MRKQYLFMLAFLCMLSNHLYSANITAPTKRDFCIGTYSTLGDIIITETANGDIPASGYLFITAPSGFEFEVTTGSLAKTGADITATPTFLFRTSGVFAISYTVGGTADINTITLSGLQIRAISALSSGTVQVGAGSSAISGIGVGNTLATISTALTAISFPTVAARCNNDAQFALGGTHTLSTGTTLVSQVYSSTPVVAAISGTNFRPSNAGAGAHTVTYTVTTSNSCVFTRQISIDVNAAPIVTLTVDETSGSASDDGVICTGASITFNAFGANTYRFFNASGPTLLGSGSTYTTSTITNGTVIYVEGTATNSCIDNSPNRTITVNPLPAAPQFNPSNVTYSSTDPAFWLDTLGTPAEEANRGAGDPSYFTGNGVVFQSNRYFFYPNVAGNGTHVITYHYVDPATRCESTTSKSFTVGTGVSAGAIANLNTKYCVYDATSTITVDFCASCFFTCNDYGGLQYSSDNGGTWNDLTPVSATNQGSCGFFGAETRYSYTFNPALLGAGTKLFRYYYTSTFIFTNTFYSTIQSTTIYARPTIQITNNFITNDYSSNVVCETTPNENLTFTAFGASGVGVFSSPTTNFVQFSSPNYVVHWANGSTSTNATKNYISLQFTDNVSGCVNTTTDSVQVAERPAPPTISTGFPLVFCNTQSTYGRVNCSSGNRVEWIKDLPANAPVFTDILTIGGISQYNRGIISSDEVYYTKQYRYAGCVSLPSVAYDFNVEAPVSVFIGQYNNVCSDQTINLNKLQKFGPSVTQTWSTVSTPQGSFDNPSANSPIYTLHPNDISSGSVTFRVTTSDPDGPQGCPSVFKDTIVYISKLPTLVVSSSASTYCSNNLISISASVESSARPVTWYKGSLGGTQSGINNPTSLSTFLTLDAIEKAGGTITYFAQSSDPDGAGPCTSVSDNITITINPEAVVNAGSSTTICAGSNINLSGTCTRFGGANLAATWSKGAWSQAIPAATNPKNATYTPVGAELNGSILIFTLTSADPDGVGPCTVVSSTVTDTVNRAPTINAGVDATYCSNTTPVLSATLGGSATGVTWTRIGVGGTINNANTVNATYTIPLSEKPGAIVTFVATSNDPDLAGPCVAVSDQVAITINPEAVIDAGTPIFTCGSAGVPLSGTCFRFGESPGNLAATWSHGVWSQAIPASTNPKNATYTPVAPEPLGTSITYTLTSDDPDGAGPCPAVSATVKNTINPAAFVNAGSNSTWCSNTTPVLTATLSGSATNMTWTKSGGSGIITSSTAPSTTYQVSPGDYASGTPFMITFTATTNDPDGLGATGPCLPAVSTVDVTLNPHLTVNAGSDIKVCANQPINLLGNVKIGGINRMSNNVWKTYNGLGTFTQIGPSNFTGTYNPSGTITSSGLVIPGTGELGTGTSIKLFLVSSDPDAAGPCLADSQSIDVRIDPLPIPHYTSSMSTEYCINGAAITLEGNLGSTFSPTGASASFSGGTYVTPVGFNYEFDPKKTRPLNANGGTYNIRYTYRDNNLCQNFVDTLVRVFPIPTVNFTSSSRCQFDTITFAETASVSSAVFPSTELRWDWYIDNDTLDNTILPFISSLNRPSTRYTFFNYGNHTINLIVTTNSGGTLNCVNRKDTTLIFGPYPKTNYTWTRPCSIDSIIFRNTSTIDPGYTYSLNWDMATVNPAGSYKTSTNATSLNPFYKFSQTGIYDVSLTATTNIYNCIRVKTKEVYVVPTYSVTASNPYDSAFTSSNLKWAPSTANDSAYNWQHAIPIGKQVINPGKNVWITNATSNYKIGELSHLNSPCFNLKTLDKPMMVLKLWSNTRNLAGAVLEATTGNNQPWVTIGQIGDGLNWYNTQGVVGLIGTSPTNPIAQGFSGELTDWQLSRIGLSQYANEDSLVRFRLTFGSSDVNDALNQRDGIALDSVWIGNRSKVVLLEHFTNSLSSPSMVGNDTVNSFQTQRPNDLVSIHYHTSFPGVDEMNLDNPADPSSRVLYYGVTGAPRTQLDGLQAFSEYSNTPASIKLNSIDTKALENSKFALDVSSKKVGTTLQIKTRITAKEVFGQDVVLHVAVLERFISSANVGGNQTGYRHVLKKMLPDAAGTYLSRLWAVNDSVKIGQDWIFTLSDFYDTSKIDVVVFVQNYNTKEVYQAARVSSNGSTTNDPIITALASLQDVAEGMIVYPNPADGEVYVTFGDELSQDISYTLADELSRPLISGKIAQGAKMLSFNTKYFASGVYHLILNKPDGSKAHKKIMIVH